MTKDAKMKIVGAVGVGIGVTVTALTAGTVPALLAGIGAAIAWWGGKRHTEPPPKIPKLKKKKGGDE